MLVRNDATLFCNTMLFYKLQYCVVSYCVALCLIILLCTIKILFYVLLCFFVMLQCYNIIVHVTIVCRILLYCCFVCNNFVLYLVTLFSNIIYFYFNILLSRLVMLYRCFVPCYVVL